MTSDSGIYAVQTWRCTVCGYIHPGAAAPDFCPVCGATRDDFEAHAEAVSTVAAPAPAPAAWRCLNCDYVHVRDRPPEDCPVCGASADRFEPMAAATASPGSGSASSEISRRVVIIGGGIAGVAAAKALVEMAPATTVTLVGEEPALPYYRLNLTRYLAGDIDRDALPIHPEAWYGDAGIQIRTGVTVAAVNRQDRRVDLTNGDSLPYDALILATGSHPFVPPVPGGERDGVVSLRTAADADGLLDRTRRDPRCIVIGGGVLGIETAGALGRRGVQAVLIESHGWLMPRQLNRRASAILEAHVASLGVTIRKNARTREILGGGTVEGILLDDGTVIPGATVILATGVRPNTALARKAGLEVDKGIVVNNHLQSSDPAIFAAGDAAEHNGVLYGTWAPSQYQGRIAALNAIGIPTEFGGVPRANALKLLGIDILSIGRFEPEDGGDLVVADGDAGRLSHFVFRDGRMIGAILIGHPELGPAVKQAVETGRSFATLLRTGPGAQEILAQLADASHPQISSLDSKPETKQERVPDMATMDNLKEAFAGESQANRKYLAFAKKADQDGFPQVAKLFRAAAEAETIHAHAHFRVLGGVNDTPANLAAAIEGEGFEFNNMYPKFVAEAKAEGNKPAEISFTNALTVEGIHHGLYSEALAAVKGGKDLAAAKIFVCSVCGNTVAGQAPEKCPVCGVPKGKFSEVA
jgi:nitrite reductase (NADH) large subunit